MAAIAYDPENVFQKILDGAIPSFKIFETEHVLAILDAFPLVPGHALLIPKAQYATVIGAFNLSLSVYRAGCCFVWYSLAIGDYSYDAVDMPANVAASLFRELPRLAKAVQQATGADGINIIQNNGAASGQAVFHAHIHVIPRFEGDGVLTLPAGQQMIQKDDALALLAKIQDKLQ